MRHSDALWSIKDARNEKRRIVEPFHWCFLGNDVSMVQWNGSVGGPLQRPHQFLRGETQLVRYLMENRYEKFLGQMRMTKYHATGRNNQSLPFIQPTSACQHGRHGKVSEKIWTLIGYFSVMTSLLTSTMDRYGLYSIEATVPDFRISDRDTVRPL